MRERYTSLLRTRDFSPDSNEQPPHFGFSAHAPSLAPSQRVQEPRNEFTDRRSKPGSALNGSPLSVGWGQKQLTDEYEGSSPSRLTRRRAYLSGSTASGRYPGRQARRHFCGATRSRHSVAGRKLRVGGRGDRRSHRDLAPRRKRPWRAKGRGKACPKRDSRW